MIYKRKLTSSRMSSFGFGINKSKDGTTSETLSLISPLKQKTNVINFDVWIEQSTYSPFELYIMRIYTELMLPFDFKLQ